LNDKYCHTCKKCCGKQQKCTALQWCIWLFFKRYLTENPTCGLLSQLHISMVFLNLSRWKQGEYPSISCSSEFSIIPMSSNDITSAVQMAPQIPTWSTTSKVPMHNKIVKLKYEMHKISMLLIWYQLRYLFFKQIFLKINLIKIMKFLISHIFNKPLFNSCNCV